MKEELVDLNYVYEVNGVLKGKRKPRTYHVIEKTPVSFPVVDKKDTRLVALKFNEANGKNVIQQYLEHDGNIYTKQNGTYFFSYNEHPKGSSIHETYLEYAKKIPGISDDLLECKLMEKSGVTAAYLRDTYLLPEYSLSGDHDIIEEDELRRFISSTQDVVLSRLKKNVADNFIMIDGEVYYRTRGPALKPGVFNGFTAYGQWNNGDFTSHYRVPISYIELPVNMVSAWYDLQNSPKENAEYIPEVFVMDMDIFEQVNRDYYSSFIYQNLFEHPPNLCVTKQRINEFFEDNENAAPVLDLIEKYKSYPPDSEERFEITQQILDTMLTVPLSNNAFARGTSEILLFQTFLCDMYDRRDKWVNCRNMDSDQKPDIITDEGIMTSKKQMIEHKM